MICTIDFEDKNNAQFKLGVEYSAESDTDGTPITIECIWCDDTGSTFYPEPEEFREIVDAVVKVDGPRIDGCKRMAQ